MGRFQTVKPQRRKEAIPDSSFHPVFQGRQHALRPDRRFSPHPTGADFSRLRSPLGHCRRGRFRRPVRHASHLPASLRSPGVTRLLRYYGRSDSCPAALRRTLPHEHRLAWTGLPASRTTPSHRSASNHLLRPGVVLSRYPSTRQASPHSWGVWVSPLASRLTATTGRIEFVILRTSGSPPVAPHPVSRQSSYSRLRAGERMPEGDFHPSDVVRSQAR